MTPHGRPWWESEVWLVEISVLFELYSRERKIHHVTSGSLRCRAKRYALRGRPNSAGSSKGPATSSRTVFSLFSSSGRGSDSAGKGPSSGLSYEECTRRSKRRKVFNGRYGRGSRTGSSPTFYYCSLTSPKVLCAVLTAQGSIKHLKLSGI